MTLSPPEPYQLESRDPAGAVFRSGGHRLRIAFFSDSIARVTFTHDRPFQVRVSRIVTGVAATVVATLQEDASCYKLRAGLLIVMLLKETGALRYLDAEGNLLTREPSCGGRWLTPKTVTRNIFDRNGEIQLGQSIDGARAKAADYVTVFDREAFEARLDFLFADDEALFGLGSHEEGFANLRGRSRELYQQNMKAVVPHLVSTRGYGVLLECGSLMTFHDDALGSYWWADCVDELDFYFICGGTYDGVIRGYRALTGKTPLPPKWAFGYVQSKERYVTAEEVVGIVAEYRRRSIPLDMIVLDWKTWPNGEGWGQKSFDPIRFPDAAEFVNRIHAMNARLMISIWPIMTGGCPDQRQLLDRGLMLGNNATYNAFLPEAREVYWEQAARGLLHNGVDAWWCDCTEPFEADWSGAVKLEPHVRLALNTGESKLYLDAGEVNAYSLMHSKGIYEGQRRASLERRVLNLTRSSYAGQHRYGTFTWNGDVCATWETLRRSIAEGLNFCATGEPYWTVDIGGFFIDRRQDLWFWHGDYSDGCRGLTAMDALFPDANDTGCRDLGFHELYTRWLQFAAFLPMFRSHGTDAAREIWRFGDEGSPFYDAIAASIRLRYRLLPYIYSVAASVTFEGESMIRAVPLQFPLDHATHHIVDEFLFGPSLLICPVTRPMFYGPGSTPIGGNPQTRQVYLPAGTDWYDFASGERYAGGRELEAPAPLERIPVFVRAGSFLPMTSTMQWVDEMPEAPYELRVYTGYDADFTLYEDRGDGYEYEQGACSKILLHWNETLHEFTIFAREGSFPGLVREREILMRVYSAGTPLEISFRYTGKEHRICIAFQGDPIR